MIKGALVVGSSQIRMPGALMVGAPYGSAALPTLDQIIASMFKSGEQGFAYDPYDLTTLFQDSTGTTPVTGATQPIGLNLDKSKGLALGAERITNGGFSGATGWTGVNGSDEVVSGGFLNFANAAAGNPNASQAGIIQPSKSYRISFRVANYVAGAVYLQAYAANALNNVMSAQISANGVYTAYLHAPIDATGLFGIRVAAGSNLSITDVSVKELAGNHAHQVNSGQRPLLAASPQHLDYDTFDDKLITNLPAQLTGATIIRAVPNVGTQILTNQTIATPYNDNIDHCGLIVINRALTSTETSQITQLFNRAAGV